MHKFLIATLMSTLAVSGNSDARPQEEVVVSIPPLSLAQWVKRISFNLDNAVEYPHRMLGGHVQPGMVSVRFDCDGAGKATRITLHRKSNSRHYDLAAMQAVGRMKSVHPMPSKLSANLHYRANIIFATSSEEYRDVLALMKKDPRERQARFAREPGVIALFNNPRASAPTAL